MAFSELEVFGEVLQDIALERLTFKSNPITQELGWFANYGQCFVITGQFTISSHQSHVEEWFHPQDSAELVIASNKDSYDRFLAESSGNNQEALALLIDFLEDYEGEIEAPVEFVGKWLVPSPNLDASDTLVGSSKNPELLIKENITAWYDQGYLFIPPDNWVPNLKTRDGIIFDAPEGAIKWKQTYASGLEGLYKVTIADYPEQDPELYLPDSYYEKEKLALPQRGMTSEEYFNALSLERHQTFSEEDRLRIIRKYRKSHPFADDPLQYIIFPRIPTIHLPESSNGK